MFTDESFPFDCYPAVQGTTGEVFMSLGSGQVHRGSSFVLLVPFFFFFLLCPLLTQGSITKAHVYCSERQDFVLGFSALYACVDIKQISSVSRLGLVQ